MKRFLVAAALAALPVASSPLAAQPWAGPLTGTVDTNGAQFGSGNNFPVVTGQRTLVPLDIAAVGTGGVAVQALNAGHRTAGGWILNPATATQNLCINEIGVASGGTSAGNTTCIVPGQPYALTPAAGPVSVISSDSSHPFSGEGYQ